MASRSPDSLPLPDDARRAVWAGPVPAMDDRFMPLPPGTLHRARRSSLRLVVTLGTVLTLIALVGVVGAALPA